MFSWKLPFGWYLHHTRWTVTQNPFFYFKKVEYKKAGIPDEYHIRIGQNHFYFSTLPF